MIKYTKKAWMRKMLAWVLALAMAVPWSVLAEEPGTAPADESIAEGTAAQDEGETSLGEPGGGDW